MLLLDEPTNHLDLDAIEWLEKYLKQQEVPMVIVSHDREFLDQLCTKIVETERGVATTFKVQPTGVGSRGGGGGGGGGREGAEEGGRGWRREGGG